MRHNPFGHTTRDVSVIGQGTWYIDHSDRAAAVRALRAGLDAGSPLHSLRHQREKVAVAPQGSYDTLFDPALAGIGLDERPLVAVYACVMATGIWLPRSLIRRSKRHTKPSRIRSRIASLTRRNREWARARDVLSQSIT